MFALVTFCYLFFFLMFRRFFYNTMKKSIHFSCWYQTHRNMNILMEISTCRQKFKFLKDTSIEELEKTSQLTDLLKMMIALVHVEYLWKQVYSMNKWNMILRRNFLIDHVPFDFFFKGFLRTNHKTGTVGDDNLTSTSSVGQLWATHLDRVVIKLPEKFPFFFFFSFFLPFKILLIFRWALGF